MPPTADEYRAGLLALQQQQRARLTSLIEQVDNSLAYNWQRGMGAAASLYGPVLDQYAKDLAALRAEMDDPSARLTLDWLTSRNAQLATIQQSIAASAEKYGQTAAQTVTQAQQQAADMAAMDAAQLTQRSLWPAVEGAGVPPSVLFNRPNPDAIAQWVGRAGNGHPLGDLFEGFGAEATQGARQAMMLGLLTGANPKAMASGIANALGVSRSRATIISRTEVLGSYRSAAHETYRANSDVLNGWVWSAGGANPCAQCMGMDGLQFSLEEELVDHPCGRCAPLPITKSWDDILGPLGIDTSDMEETSMGAEGAYETGPEKFARMSPEQQRAIIGTKTGYEAYQRGEVELKDFIGMRPGSDGFPASYYQKSLKELEIPTGRAGTPLVERNPRLTELERLGQLKARDFGAHIPVDEMPRWAQRSPASQAVYQIMRNGLPWNMSQHELPLLSQNIEKMLTEDLSLNVRMAALRLQDMLKQYDEYLTRYVRNVTSGASTLGRAPEFVYKPSKELERALAAARAGERGVVEVGQATETTAEAGAQAVEEIANATANAPVDLARVITRDDGSIFLRANGDKLVIDGAPDGAIRINAESLGLSTGGQTMTADEARAFLDANNLGQLKPFVEMIQQDSAKATAEDIARVAVRRATLDTQYGEYSDRALQQYTSDLFERQPVLLKAVEAHYRGDDALGDFARLTPNNVGRLFAQELGTQSADAEGRAALDELQNIAEWGALHQPTVLPDGSLRLFRGVSDVSRAESLLSGTHDGGTSFTNDFNFAKSAGEVAKSLATHQTATEYTVLAARVPADRLTIFDKMLARDSRLAQLYGWQHEYVVGDGSVYDLITFHIGGA